MRFLKQIFIVLLFAFLLLWGFENGSVMAKTIQEIQQEIEGLEQELGRLKLQANTLSSQIAQFNAQIRLAELSIAKTEERILLLGGRIDQLEGSLSALTNAFSSRVSETYKMGRVSDAFIFLISAPDLNQAVIRFHYLQRIQEADRSLLVRLQEAQTVYVGEKTDQEELQEELEGQRQVLGVQKTAKASLLEITRNDEKQYQGLLAKARAELEAIQSIIAGQGEENSVGPVGEGAKIASIIPSASACSSGAHLHFEVSRDKAHQNPANFLSSKTVIWNNEPDAPFSFAGNWLWPLNDPVRITQGYGMTYYARTLNYYAGGPHTGIDMTNDNKDYTVKAVKSGTLYQGAIGCGGGTLRYVRVQQDDGYDAYYLHVNY